MDNTILQLAIAGFVKKAKSNAAYLDKNWPERKECTRDFLAIGGFYGYC